MEDYLPELEALERQRDAHKEDIRLVKEMATYYNLCLTTLQRHNKCQLCERRFAAEKERSHAMDKIRQKLADDAVQNTEKDLQEVLECLQLATAARSQYDGFEKLKVEIPALEKDLKLAEDE